MTDTEKLIGEMVDFINEDYVEYFPMKYTIQNKITTNNKKEQNCLLEEMRVELKKENIKNSILNKNYKKVAMHNVELLKTINTLTREKQQIITLLENDLKEINMSSIIMNNQIMKQYNELIKLYEINKIFINNVLNICDIQILPLLDIKLQEYFKNILINQISLIISSSS